MITVRLGLADLSVCFVFSTTRGREDATSYVSCVASDTAMDTWEGIHKYLWVDRRSQCGFQSPGRRGHSSPASGSLPSPQI